MKINQDICESCGTLCSGPCTNGMTLCTICAPWVSASEERTAELQNFPRGSSFIDSRIIEEVRNELAILRRSEFSGAWWGFDGTDNDSALHSGPKSDAAWLQLFAWVLGASHPDVLRIKQHLEYRDWPSDWPDGRDGTLDTVDSIRHRLKQIQLDSENAKDAFSDDQMHWNLIDEPTIVAGHTVVAYKDGFWIDDVLFHSSTFDSHCEDPCILPELLFDSLHELDNRAIDDRAFLYQSSPWFTLINRLQMSYVPDAPILRENVNRLADGAFGHDISNQFRAALLLWTLHPQREYLTTDKSAWARSFNFLRKVVADQGTRAEVTSVGIRVEGVSGNRYSITPCRNVHNAHGEEFMVRKTGKEASKPICLMTTKDSENLALGDIIASIVLILRNDVDSAKKIRSLACYLPRNSEVKAR